MKAISVGFRRLCLALTLAGVSLGALATQSPNLPIDIKQAQSGGFCKLDACTPDALALDWSPTEISARRAHSDPWIRAMAVWCEGSSRCHPWRFFDGPEPKQEPVHLPLAQLRQALGDPAPQVRAMAVLRLDLRSPDARKAAEALLKDGAWLHPQASTVADHAYARLHPALLVSSVETSAAKRALQLTEPRSTGALNLYRGIRYVAALRAPHAARALDWLSAFRRLDASASIPSHGSTLAGLWHGASRLQLEAALNHDSQDVRLTAWDALALRFPDGDPEAWAIAALAKGGVREVGVCMPLQESIAVPLLQGLTSIGRPELGQKLLGTLTAPSGGASVDEPRSHVARYLVTQPELARRFTAVLRRWVDDKVWKAGQALAPAATAADLPRYVSLARRAQFDELGTRAEPELVAIARQHYRDAHRGRPPAHALSWEWHRYVLNLPEAIALPLLSEAFEPHPLPEVRVNRIRRLASFDHFPDPPARLGLARALWRKHQLVLLSMAPELLTDLSPSDASRLLRDRTWLGLHHELKDDDASACYGYARLVKGLLQRLPKSERTPILMQAFEHEPSCALPIYVETLHALQQAELGPKSRRASAGAFLPAAVEALLQARMERSAGPELEQLQRFKTDWLSKRQ